MTEIDSQRFNIATRFARGLGYVPALFSTCIRQIRDFESLEEQSDKKTATVSTAINNLVKISPSIKTVLFAVARTYREAELNKLGEAPTVRALTSLFQPSELAGLIATIFIYKRFVKHIEPGERDRMLPLLLQQTEIGWHTGATISNVGYGYGALIGILRYASMATFISSDAKIFAKYRRELAPGKALFREDLELASWGCTHLEIAALIMQNLGLGRGPGLGFVSGDNADHLIDEAHVGHKSLEEALCWRACLIWIESLHCFGEPPPGASDQESEMYLEPSSLEALTKIVTQIRQSSSPAPWLLAKLTDVPAPARKSLNIDKEAKDDVTESEAESE